MQKLNQRTACLAAVSACSFVVGGCSNSVKVECGGEATIVAVESMFQKELEKSVRNQLDSEGSLEGYDSAKLRTGTKKVKVTLEEIRTVRDDPDSSRQFCSARIMLKIPDTVIEAADNTRALAEMDNVKKLANQNRVERSGDKYGMELEYSIQPTDDGTKLIAETDGDSSLFTFLTELFASYLLSDEVRNNVIEAEKAEAADEREKRLAEEELDGALKSEASANLGEAKVQYKMSMDRINAIWGAIPKSTRNELLPLQRAWIKKKEAACRVEAAGSDEQTGNREANRLRCDVRMTDARSNQLQRFVSYEEDYDAAEAGAEAAAAGAAAAEAAARAGAEAMKEEARK
jgi:uncharacterized protein YecT (DUF1311 family)